MTGSQPPRLPIEVVEADNAPGFRAECDELVEHGYRLVAASCGFVNSEGYDFCSSYQAVFAWPTVMAQQLTVADAKGPAVVALTGIGIKDLVEIARNAGTLPAQGND